MFSNITPLMISMVIKRITRISSPNQYNFKNNYQFKILGMMLEKPINQTDYQDFHLTSDQKHPHITQDR